jgi:hypothetical protein
VDAVLEGVLDLLAGLLEVGLALVGLALCLEALVVGHLAGGLLGLAGHLVLGVVELVIETHEGPPLSDANGGIVLRDSSRFLTALPFDRNPKRTFPQVRGLVNRRAVGS